MYFLAKRTQNFGLFWQNLVILLQIYTLVSVLLQAKIMRWCPKIDKSQGVSVKGYSKNCKWYPAPICCEVVLDWYLLCKCKFSTIWIYDICNLSVCPKTKLGSSIIFQLWNQNSLDSDPGSWRAEANKNEQVRGPKIPATLLFVASWCIWVFFTLQGVSE